MIAPKLTIQGGTTEILRGIIARGWGCGEIARALAALLPLGRRCQGG